MRKTYLLLLMLTFFVSSLWAQTIPVSGTVTSATDKMAMPGVTVQVKGSQKGAITDINGMYKLEAASDATLVFTFIGMRLQEIPVDGRKTINVEMEEERVDLGEVVIMGYSTTSKKLISGSVGTVNEKELDNIPIRTIDGVLQGRAAGVTVNQNSGTPGGRNAIKMRGGSSINASNQPLIVVDGVPVITGSYGQIGYSGRMVLSLSLLKRGMPRRPVLPSVHPTAGRPCLLNGFLNL
jgi:outer membrane receptor for Fe3+-dicitrate